MPTMNVPWPYESEVQRGLLLIVNLLLLFLVLLFCVFVFFLVVVVAAENRVGEREISCEAGATPEPSVRQLPDI